LHEKSLDPIFLKKEGWCRYKIKVKAKQQEALKKANRKIEYNYYPEFGGKPM
jgi:hypothetical protein